MRLLEWFSVRDQSPLIHVSRPLSTSVQAVINIGAHNLPAGVSASLGIATVKHALQAMPGTEWIDVRHSPPGVGGTVEVIQAGSYGPESHAIRDWLEVFVQASLVALSKPLVTPALASGLDKPPRDAAGPAVDTQRFEANAGRVTTRAPRAAAGGNLQSLGDAELLGRLLSYVAMIGGAKLADQAMERFGSFAALLSASEMELRNLPGFGTRFVAAIKLIHAVALRLSRPAQPCLDGAMERVVYLSKDPVLGSADQFRILYLDAAGRLRSDERQAGTNASRKPILPRKIVARALELKASSILLVYSLSDGSVSPPEDYIRLTSMLQDAGEILGLSVQIHMTIENGRWPRSR